MAQNSEFNPTPDQQRDIAAQSPVKPPAVGRDTPDAKMQQAGSDRAEKSRPSDTGAGKSPGETSSAGTGTRLPGASGTLERHSATQPLTNASRTAPDTPVDAAEGQHALPAEPPELQDNVVYSNVSLENSVDTSDDGLAGYDSRQHGNLPQIRLPKGWRMQYVGMLETEGGNGRRTEYLIRLEPID